MKNEELEKDQNSISQEEENEEEDNIKVFNGLISKDKNQNTEKENHIESTNKNSNDNQNDSKKKLIKKNFEEFFSSNNSNIDLNLISFGDLHSFNNFQNNSNNTTTDSNIENKNNLTKNILQDKNKELNKGNKLNRIEEENIEINSKNKNDEKTPIVIKENESKNYFRISTIKKGKALIVTGDDTILSFPAYLLPKGAKLGETFTIEIKAINSSKKINNINSSKESIEIENIQKKYIKENQEE